MLTETQVREPEAVGCIVGRWFLVCVIPMFPRLCHVMHRLMLQGIVVVQCEMVYYLLEATVRNFFGSPLFLKSTVMYY